jgi:hypothetical protein
MNSRENEIEQHQTVCDSAKRLLNRVLGEGLFSAVTMDYEDRHDNKITIVFSFSPAESEVTK